MTPRKCRTQAQTSHSHGQRSQLVSHCLLLSTSWKTFEQRHHDFPHSLVVALCVRPGLTRRNCAQKMMAPRSRPLGNNCQAHCKSCNFGMACHNSRSFSNRSLVTLSTVLDLSGFVGRPRWADLRDGVRPPPTTVAEPGEWQHGWQCYASSSLEHHFRETVLRVFLSGTPLPGDRSACPVLCCRSSPSEITRRSRRKCGLVRSAHEARIPVATFRFPHSCAGEDASPIGAHRGPP